MKNLFLIYSDRFYNMSHSDSGYFTGDNPEFYLGKQKNFIILDHEFTTYYSNSKSWIVLYDIK